MRTHVHTSLDEVSAAEWDLLEARPPASLCGSRAWFEAALETVDRGVTPNLIAVEADGRLVGLLPMVRDEREGTPKLRIAASPHNDLMDVLALPSHGEGVARAVIEALSGFSGCEVILDDLDPEGALAAVVSDYPPLRCHPGSAAPVIDLRDPTAGLSAKRNRRLDRSLRQLRESHQVEFRWSRGSTAMDCLPRFMRQRNARLRALSRDFFVPPAEMLEAAVRGLAPFEGCAFSEMLVDDEPVAIDLYLLDGAVAMLWLRALDMDWLGPSCGHLLLRASAAHLAAEGYEALDLGRGAESYKFSFGARPRELLNVHFGTD